MFGECLLRLIAYHRFRHRDGMGAMVTWTSEVKAIVQPGATSGARTGAAEYLGGK